MERVHAIVKSADCVSNWENQKTYNLDRLCHFICDCCFHTPEQRVNPKVNFLTYSMQLMYIDYCKDCSTIGHLWQNVDCKNVHHSVEKPKSNSVR